MAHKPGVVMVYVDFGRQRLARYVGGKRVVAWEWEGEVPVTQSLVHEIWSGVPQTPEEEPAVA
jgi:hypothetical protein